ncbi:aminotransferase class I/II-fold pyridoxal phosphate-dependent enzyme [Nitrosophilus kaiyonis]|uniref:aminotransferase class I/II-fold pyridoxal phosphate-dependent enzyme n=1 Tax=Nitrosophilus kaiyonis TaxID=2930200 RepID=UPI0024935CE5|nr:aminotransferase class I/II-fold pyridoxal phosphate-dependent enzyme [Nitrosophilus kaiyonis]
MKKLFEEFQTFIVQQSADKDGPLSPPIINSAAFSYGNPESAEKIFSGEINRPLYSRIANPTNSKLENLISYIDKGAGSVVTSSGMGAISLAIMSFLKSGDEIISIGGLFGGTYSFFSETIKRFGIDVKFIDADEDIEKFITENTKIIFTESVSNPNLDIADFLKIEKICKKNKILFIVDNTLTPLLFNPFDFGADLIIYSTTKIISGHSQALGGAVVYREIDSNDKLFERFDFLKNIYEKKGKNALLYALKKRAMRDFGMSESAFNSYLTILGLQTLPLRIQRVNESTKYLVETLYENGFKISHPQLKNSNYHQRYEKYFPNGVGGVFSIDFETKDKAFNFLKNSKLLFLTANLGDSRTLALHMNSTIYRDFSKNDKKFLKITEGLVRISVGLEDPQILIEDFLKAAKG